MSATAWVAGLWNAGIVSAWVIPALILPPLFLHFFIHLAWLNAVKVGFGLSLTAALLYFQVAHLRMRFIRGTVLLDCGYRPMMWVFIFSALFLLYIIIWRNDILGSLPIVIKIVLTILFSAFYLIMGLGRMKLCANGIWIYQELIKWERIKYCEWQGNDLLVEYHTKWPFPAKGVISFPPDCKWSADLIMHEHLSQATP